ncbi:MAG: AraC family transcriptional regulator [Planctomycetota bacterium]|nr:AraC family transcriptional regulator [Planctomycetota bacterium]
MSTTQRNSWGDERSGLKQNEQEPGSRMMNQQGNLRDRQRVLNALSYAWDRLDEQVGLDELADRAHLSAFHFHRVFLKVTGETPQAHLRRLRLERAATSLKYGSVSVTDVAGAAVYDSREGFTRAFAAHFGCSPTAFRHRAQQDIERIVADRRVQAAVMPVSIGEFPAWHVAFWRQYGPYTGVGRAWLELGRWAKARGLLTEDAAFLGVSYDDEGITPRQHLRYDACLTIPGDVAADGVLGVQDLPGGLFAIAEYEGYPLGLIHAWNWLLWCWWYGSDWHARDIRCYDIHPAQRLPTTHLEALALAVRRIRCRLLLPVSRYVTPDLLL